MAHSDTTLPRRRCTTCRHDSKPGGNEPCYSCVMEDLSRRQKCHKPSLTKWEPKKETPNG